VGTFSVSIDAGDPQRERFTSVDVLVEAGASYTMLPAPLLQQLNVEPSGQRPFILANGQRTPQPVGRTWVRFGGHEVMTIVVFGDARGLRFSARSHLRRWGWASIHWVSG
jgi:predicted aspartyl protease